jgi:hypothetical protein
MWHIYIFSFFAGMFGGNGVPHFVKGITGQKHVTPFGRPSSAVVNVLWGWANFVVAGLLIYFGHVHHHLLRSFSLAGLGALVIGLILANVWSKHPVSSK